MGGGGPLEHFKILNGHFEPIIYGKIVFLNSRGSRRYGRTSRGGFALPTACFRIISTALKKGRRFWGGGRGTQREGLSRQ